MRAGNRLSGWEERLIDGLIKFISKLGETSDHERKERTKFVGYHDLLKLLEKPVCPPCFIVRRSLQGFLSVAFIEELTVPEFREPFRTSFGCCRRHSEYVRTAARNRLRAMGIAVVYEDLLALVQAHMRTLREVPLVSGCPLCGLQEDLEAYAVQLIADYCSDQEFQKYYESSSGVCLVHLKDLLKVLDGDAMRFILRSHVRKLETQLGDLREFIRKHDYRFAHEKMTEQEAASWKNVVNLVVGH